MFGPKITSRHFSAIIRPKTPGPTINKSLAPTAPVDEASNLLLGAPSDIKHKFNRLINNLNQNTLAHTNTTFHHKHMVSLHYYSSFNYTNKIHITNQPITE